MYYYEMTDLTKHEASPVGVYNGGRSLLAVTGEVARKQSIRCIYHFLCTYIACFRLRA